MTLVVIGLDNLKTVNDEFGYVAGDQRLFYSGQCDPKRHS
ncbi:MAG: hypothetical protein KGJ73_03365 [Rhodospirillales bacterium]|nr:hypothetical protein [Rhodospirillales bacterium]